MIWALLYLHFFAGSAGAQNHYVELSHACQLAHLARRTSRLAILPAPGVRPAAFPPLLFH